STLTFAPGETLKSVAVPLIGDTVAEANEFFNLVFTPTSDIANGVDGAVGTAVILDDDTSASLPEISISGGRTIEGPSSTRQLEFEVTLSEPATNTVDIPYRTLDSQGTATGGVDYVEEFSFVRIFAGQSSATLNITVFGDTSDETDESVVVELFSPENAVFPDGVNTIQAVGLIMDDDGVANNRGLFVGNVEIVEGADGVTREVAVPVYLSRPSDQILTFQYQTADDTAVAGSDYAAQSGTVTFLPGEIITAVHIPVIGDDIDEPSETFALTVTPTSEIANGSAGATGTVTILDGDVLPPPEGITVNAGNNATISEGSIFNRTISFIDDLDANADGWSYSVDWGDGSAAENGVVAAGASSFDINRLFADGDASHTVSVTVTDVAGDSDTQQFQLNVDNVSPTIALAGAPEVNIGASYTLNLGAITDPGVDTVTSYIVNWGDGSSDTFNTAGDVTHVYTATGTQTISVDLVDEDGTHINAGAVDVLVNAVPDGVSVNAGNNAIIDEGGTLNRTVTFTDGEDSNADGWTYSVDYGDGSAVETGAIAAGINSFDINHIYADGDVNHNVNVTVTDVAGDSDIGQFTVNVSNVAPTIALNGNPSVDEGSVYTLALGVITDPGNDTVASYVVNWGDSTSTTLTAAEVLAAGGNVDHVFADGASNPVISVDLEDEDGTHFAAGTLSVIVNNVAPTIALAGASEVNAGVSYALNLGTITDPGDDTVTSYIVNWGDGTAEAFSAAGDVTHVYTASGINTVTVDLIDEDGTFINAGSLTVQVNEPTAGVSVNAGGNTLIDEGSLFGRTINFSDGEDANADGWSYTVDWGDGSTAENGAIAAGLNSFGINHIFADGAASHNVSVTVTDDAGDFDTQQFIVDVNNVAPSIVLNGNASVSAGETFTLLLGAITDPGLDTVTNYIINWGDGSTTSLTTAEVLAAGGNIDHVYDGSDNNPQIRVDLVDEDGTHNAGTFGFLVTIPPEGVSVNAGNNAAIDEGGAFNRTVTFTDGEDANADGWTYSVDWGDGSAVENGLIASGLNSFDINHIFGDGAAGHNVSVTVTDEAGDSDTQQFIMDVNNIAPTIALSGNPSVDEGSVYTLALGAVTDPGLDTVTDYIINWSDGTTNTTLTAAEVLAAGGNVDHVFADGASIPVISVDLVDEDGTHTAAGTLNVTVNNVAPTIALAGASETNTGDTYTLNLGAITDPGDDTVASYIVNWGDGTTDTFSSAGAVTHVYAAAGSNTISVDLVDEDGTHDNAGNLDVNVNEAPVEIVRIGDAPLRVSRSNPNIWENAWTDETVSISHKADYLNTVEPWSSAILNGRNSGVLSGGDIFGGDLGVSGQSLISSTIRQEIDGTEALRFDLGQAATRVTVDLSRLEGDATAGHFDAGRVQLLDDSGLVVNELTFSAGALSSDQVIILSHDQGFSSVVLTAGVYNDADFIFGGLSDSDGQYFSDPQNLGGGTFNASDYLVDAIEFEFGEITLVGTPL
ncbi:MAG: hypothetical protein H6937_00795, partial [Burkholderiales bacterium]|nr:hypothetical protein [Burkholderiales bacterium]